MSKLALIAPTKKLRLMDLAREAGVDVSDWGNFKLGPEDAARNPKYCYEWCFVEPGKVVVFNIWHDQMREIEGEGIVCRLNPRSFAVTRTGVEKSRALRMDDAMQRAVRENLPVRVVILDGRRRNIANPSEEASEVTKRCLDPEVWTISTYDSQTGDCTLVRGAHKFVDQFSIAETSEQAPERREVLRDDFIRCPKVRANVLRRANGKCEWCGEPGFLTAAGEIFLETHHVVFLCDGGADTERNVAAVCPNHHREAHYGANRLEMQKELLARIAASLNSFSCGAVQ